MRYLTPRAQIGVQLQAIFCKSVPGRFQDILGNLEAIALPELKA
jgi:hypothetical protein